jgi:hypothetical protein
MQKVEKYGISRRGKSDYFSSLYTIPGLSMGYAELKSIVTGCSDFVMVFFAHSE